MDSIKIPDKTYFKIGEVAKLLDLQPYVLRYWETEFDTLSPEKTKSGQRAYQRPDIELLVLIKTLLYEEMYTIAGARRQLKLRKQGAIDTMEPEAMQRVVRERDELLEKREERENELSRMERAVEELREEASRLQLQNETLEDENAQLATAQLEYESSIRRLREELEQHRETVSMLEGTNEALNQRVEELSEEAGQAAQLELESRNAEELERIEELERTRDAAREKIATLESAKDELEQRFESLADERDGALTRVSELDDTRQELEARVAEVEGQLAAAKREVERLNSEKEAVAAQAIDASEVEALEVRLADALGRVEILQSERDEALSRFEERDRRHRHRFMTLRTELESLSALVN